jgi:histidinol-phosphate phosphatase family protein
MHALVLAGGKGTRSLDPTVPKILQKIELDVSILELQLVEIEQAGIESVTYLLGHGSEQVVSALEQIRSQSKLSIDWHIDKASRGTKAAVMDSLGQIDSEQFVVLLGDVVFRGGLASLKTQYLESQSDFGIVCHANLHPFDSDRIILDSDFQIQGFQRKNSQSAGEYSVPQTGVLFLSRSTAAFLEDDGDDISASIALLHKRGLVGKGFLTSSYMKDSGTPERLKKIQEEFAAGSAQRRGSSPRPAILIDRDGTLIPDRPKGRASVEEGELREDVVSQIARANSLGIPVFLVTNQPAIAKGQITREQVNGVHAEISRFFAQHGAFFDEIIFCPHHPEAGFDGEVTYLKVDCDCRKPKPGMAASLDKRHCIDFARSFVIGDTSIDSNFADAIGASYLSAFHGVDESLSQAIARAIERIIA